MRGSDYNPDKEMVFQANKDIAARSITGSYIYLLIWFSIVIPHKFYAKSPEICLWLTLTLILLAGGRMAVILNFKKIYLKSPFLWQVFLFSVVWGTALVWGLCCALSFFLPQFSYMSLALVVSTAGLTGGGTSALVPSRLLTMGLITALLAPAGFALLVSDPHNLSTGIIFLVYWIGMYAVTKNQHREYWQGLKDSFLLKKYAVDLEQRNTLDGLTGLKNRAFFDQGLREELRRAVRFQYHLSLLLIDIDRFKKINDDHGHLAGDECLRQISSLLKTRIKRETDIVARYGGEEFAVILPQNNTAQARQMAEKIRTEIEAMTMVFKGVHISLTVSLGFASMVPEVGATEETIIQIADTNLYKAKHNGRNQVWG